METATENTEEKKLLRRAPAIITRIKDLNSDMGRVCILGTIVQKNNDIGSVILDDGASSVLVLLNNPQDIEKFQTGQTVRVMGKVWGSESEIEIQAEVVQDFSKIDRELYNKIMF
jgi:aspartyl/asparaginyl-tRNA synthetase